MRVELTGAALRELKSKLRDNAGSGGEGKEVELTSKLRQEELRGLFLQMVEDLVEARSRVWELEHSMQLKKCAEDGLRTEKRNLERR